MFSDILGLSQMTNNVDDIVLYWFWRVIHHSNV